MSVLFVVSGCIFAVDPGQEKSDSSSSTDVTDTMMSDVEVGGGDVGDGEEAGDVAGMDADTPVPDGGGTGVVPPTEEPCNAAGEDRTSGPVGDPETLHLGVILPEAREARRPFRMGGNPSELRQAIDMAVEHLNEQPAFGNQPIGAIYCEVGSNSGGASSAVDLLVGAGIQAVVGPGVSEGAKRAIGELTDEGILTILPSNPSAQMDAFLRERLEQQELVFRMIPNETSQTPALLELNASLSERLEGSFGVSYAEGRRYSEAVGNVLSEELDTVYHEAHPAGDVRAEDFESVAERMADRRFSVVALPGRGEIWELLNAFVDVQALNLLESTVFVTHQRSRRLGLARRHAEVTSDLSGPATVLGTSLSAPSQEHEPYAQFLEDWVQKRETEETGTGPFLPSAYDATVMTAIAMAAADSYSGPVLAEKLGVLGTEGAAEAVQFPAEGNPLSSAIESLRDGEPVTVSGASGPWLFDTQGLRTNAAIELWCLQQRTAGTKLESQQQLSPVGSDDLFNPEVENCIE